MKLCYTYKVKFPSVIKWVLVADIKPKGNLCFLNLSFFPSFFLDFHFIYYYLCPLIIKKMSSDIQGIILCYVMFDLSWFYVSMQFAEEEYSTSLFFFSCKKILEFSMRFVTP